VLHATALFLTNLLFTAVLEEPGWRGFLLPRLQQGFAPLLASTMIWLPWALWHAPLDFSGGIGRSWITYLQVRIVFLIPVAIILTWLYNRSGGNLLSVALLHSGMNTFPFVLPYAPKMLGLIFVAAVYGIFAQRMWRRKPQISAQRAQVPATLEAANHQSRPGKSAAGFAARMPCASARPSLR
jgi:membrane protease YdiL (CAAX protease family)